MVWKNYKKTLDLFLPSAVDLYSVFVFIEGVQ